MRKWLAAFLVAGMIWVIGFAPTQASAATVIWTETHDYGLGKYDPGGTDVLGPGYVAVSDASAGRFADTFSLAALPAGATVTGLDLVLTFVAAGPTCPVGFCGLGEKWEVRATGSASGSGDDFFATVYDKLSPQTFSLSAATDVGGVDAFTHSLDSGEFEFWFAESSTGKDGFLLSSATLNVIGTLAPVPVPAAGFLLVAGLAAFAAFRRRGLSKAA